MSHHGSVTIWLDRLKDGSTGEAVERLWQGYFGRLGELATDDGPGVDRAASELTPAEAAADGFAELLAALPDTDLRQIAV